MEGVEPKNPFWSSTDWWELRFTVIQKFQIRSGKILEDALGPRAKEEYARHLYLWFVRVGDFANEPVMSPQFLVKAVEEKLLKDFDGFLSQRTSLNLSKSFGNILTEVFFEVQLTPRRLLPIPDPEMG